MNHFIEQITRGAAFLTKTTGSSEWILNINVEHIKGWVIGNEDVMSLVLGDEESFIIETQNGMGWLRQHGFVPPHVENDVRAWIDGGKQLDAEWREWILETRELMLLAEQSY